MEGGRMVEEVFKDFKGRRTDIIKALTIEKDNLCLYGFASEQWEVNLPAKEVPPELPEPALGINFVRDGMQIKKWLALVADYSDLWLLSVAFYFGARFGFDKAQRKRLFNMINDLPDIFDVISAPAIKHLSNNSNNKSKPNKQPGSKPQTVKYGKVEEDVEEVEEEEAGYDGDASCGFCGEYYDSDQCGSEPQAVKYGKVEEEEEEEVEEEEEEYDGDASCGFCEEYYDSDQSWICCDLCEMCFHGKCVRITPAEAKTITHYKCPICNKHKRP